MSIEDQLSRVNVSRSGFHLVKMNDLVKVRVQGIVHDAVVIRVWKNNVINVFIYEDGQKQWLSSLSYDPSREGEHTWCWPQP